MADIFDSIDAGSADIQEFADKTVAEIEKKILKNYQSKTNRVLLSELLLYLKQQTNKMKKLASSIFSDVIDETQAQISKSYDVELTNSQLATLAENEGIVLDNITSNDLKLQASLKSLLLQNIGKKLTTVQVVSGLQTLYPAYASHIETIVNTSLLRMYKDAEWTVESELFEYFRYDGPSDSVTRKYCQDHVGKVYTADEAAKIQAEIQTFYNCRHKLNGITKEEYDASK